VKRIVITSSFAAVMDATRGLAPGYTYTGADWNPMSYQDGVTGDAELGYRAAKLFAEKAAWEFIATENPGFTLVTLCPGLVFGPAVEGMMKSVQEVNASNLSLWETAKGGEEFPRRALPTWVDVRDLAKAHVEALLREESQGKRFLPAAKDLWSPQGAAEVMRDEWEWARKRVKEPRVGWQEEVEESFVLDGETAGRVLGVRYRGFGESVRDTVRQLREIELRESSASK
jgi:nucleoside-diphosphate-sugar epimerase